MVITPRLAAFDMDGTLLNKNSQMTQATREACLALKEQGCRLILSTGRSYDAALLPIDAFPFDGYVCSNGALVLEADGTLVRKTLLPSHMVEETVGMLRQKGLYFELHDSASNRWMIEEDQPGVEKMLAQEPQTEQVLFRRNVFHKLVRFIPLQELFGRMRAKQVEMVKIFVWDLKPAVLEEVREDLAGAWGDVVEITSSNAYNVEVLPLHVSKWEGIRYFCEKWGIGAEQVMVFGDADNDREALSQAGYAVVMENAPPEILQLADFVAPHHHEDGVARFLRQYVIGKR